MSIREGRGRPRRDYPSSRSEEKSHHGRGNNPPSRHLWAGNISHSISEKTLANYFLRYGDLESIAFQAGRSYAFINYRNEEDAFAAIKELQGFVIGGNPLKIEFAKPEKSLPASRDADYSERRDDPYPKPRESSFSPRDSRARHSSPEPLHISKSKTGDKDSEPSEVLWVGFPPNMKMDEYVLRKAFSPFGEIEKITVFPGRTYAFVRFRSVMAAARAKEALHGKLFGNPRVHICFAKNESGLSNRERIPTDDSLSPRFRSYEHEESFEHVRHGRDFDRDPNIKSPPYIPKYGARERMRFPAHGSEVGLSGDTYEPLDSPKRKNVWVRIREFSPQEFPRKGQIYDDDPWDLPEDVSFLRGPKKLKTESTFLIDNELPEYPLSDLEKQKRVLPHDNPRRRPVDKDDESRYVGYRPIVPQRLMNMAQPLGERVDQWNLPRDEFQVAPAQLPLMDRQRLTPERRQSSLKEIWKWEGMIAKGGNPICRARCFPVGKAPDMILPGCLDCTARTSLDMLAKNYYQAASAWVVFFAPANDPDISYYNEFMNYLGERQRAAVVKLDELTTLFLVPPSEFSEKVLKVPGRLSISGVILSLETPGLSYGPTPLTENREPSSSTTFQGHSVHHKPLSPSGPYLPNPPFANYERPGINVGSVHGNSSSGGPHWPNHDFHSSNPLSRIGSENISSAPAAGLPPEKLSQLASSLLGQQGQFSQSGNPFVKTSQYYAAQNNEQGLSDLGQSQFGQMLQQQQQQQSAGLGSSQASQQQFQNPVQDDDSEGDPQKRLQATLQLAASLLQQIKQGKGK
ncbi:RNA recognition motif (RRM)-containing protein [Striga hermonthica]|uniref:RNA recognition motif (RRM)-containing protein n=1 Tax=Striga hermonthica TaxID=68872 RepID=A0A9N7MUH6_STRHE|nr:RNA recognition motif (RRM)-containing protein [Striga hermonthica]